MILSPWARSTQMTLAIDFSKLSQAERILLRCGVTAPEHIDLEAIAADMGAKVVYCPLGGCEARLVAKDDHAIIRVSSNGTNGRQRFSLAHELAHWVCDRDTGNFLCALEDMSPQSAASKEVETRANGFASQLILPSYLVDPWMVGRKASLGMASDMGYEFNSSLTAAAIKLIQRTDAAACLVCHTQTGVRWHSRSRSFLSQSDLHVRPELHQETDAFQQAFGGSKEMSKVKQEPADRWLSGKDIFRLQVKTQSNRISDGTVLTMIVL